MYERLRLKKLYDAEFLLREKQKDTVFSLYKVDHGQMKIGFHGFKPWLS